jgi:hypothetical protein
MISGMIVGATICAVASGGGGGANSRNGRGLISTGFGGGGGGGGSGICVRLYATLTFGDCEGNSTFQTRAAITIAIAIRWTATEAGSVLMKMRWLRVWNASGETVSNMDKY